MAEHRDVHNDRPATGATLDLLDTAYGGWGSEALLRWELDYPGTEADHHLYIEDGDDLAAYARLYSRVLRTARGPDASVLVRGNSAVSPAHRGQGLFNTIHRATLEYCRRADVDALATFVSTSNATFDMGAKQEWSYRTLPLYINVLDPEAVIQEYAGKVVSDERAQAALNAVLNLVSIPGYDAPSVNANRETTGERRGGNGRRGVRVPRRFADALIGLVVDKPSTTTLRRSARTMLKGTSERGAADTRTSGSEYVIRYGSEDIGIERIQSLYASANARYEVYFRRDESDIRHLLDNPELFDIVTVERDGELVGFAPLIAAGRGEVAEARALDVVARDDAAFRALLGAIEEACLEHGSDLIAVLSSRSPPSQWIRVGRQVLMWNVIDDRFDVDRTLSEGAWRLGFYDVL